MKNLSIKTQTPKGNEPKYKENLGLATIFISSDTFISIDNYQGLGNSYKKREQPEIEIIINGKNIFKGTTEELNNKLK